jgi:hypothetical protein
MCENLLSLILLKNKGLIFFSVFIFTHWPIQFGFVYFGLTKIKELNG